ncbi:MAG: Holliday junction branch migration protein RuvA [Proteobacteria bacterium]|nr:Holliday junction branch migration protein RuvA [Pseudomonadota bacterium]MBU1737311.1 Holliday junction branch migration protein RuvA [Pseudomonadota bacterium]
MIASLRGILTHKSPEFLVLDVNGVGYQVFFSATGLLALPEVGEELFLHIYTNVREDAIDLYGFADHHEKDMFILLISVSGIGPKLALNILSGMRPADLARSITTGDIHRLTSLHGVGKKTAERLCVELKDKVQFLPVADMGGRAPAAEPSESQLSSDVISALVNLGYSPVSVRKGMEKLRSTLGNDEFDHLSFEELLKQALRLLA